MCTDRSPPLTFRFTAQDLDVEDEVPLQPVPIQHIKPLQQQEVAVRKRRENVKAKVLYEQKGFCREGGEGDGY